MHELQRRQLWTIGMAMTIKVTSGSCCRFTRLKGQSGQCACTTCYMKTVKKLISSLLLWPERCHSTACCHPFLGTAAEPAICHLINQPSSSISGPQQDHALVTLYTQQMMSCIGSMPIGDLCPDHITNTYACQCTYGTGQAETAQGWCMGFRCMSFFAPG